MQNILNTKQFSGKIVRLDFVIPYSEENRAYICFLSDLLQLSCQKYPTTYDLMKTMENLYDTAIDFKVVVQGDNLILRANLLYLNILNPDEELVCVELLKEIIIKPNLINNEWNKEDFDYVKDHINHEYKMYEDNHKRYAYHEALEFFAPQTGLGGFPYGNLKIISEITPAKIAEFHKYLLANAQIQYFGMGDFSDNFKQKIKSIFDIKMKKITPVWCNLKLNEKFQNKTRALKNKQAILHLSFKISDMTEYEARYVSPVFNDLFGGSVGTGKLFNKVREENGYAYYVYSKSIAFTNLMMVVVGTKNKSIDDVIRLVKEALKEIQTGEINEEFIKQIIEVYIKEIDAMYDNPKQLFIHFIKEYNGIDDSVDQQKEKFKQITKSQVIQFAKKIKMDAKYVLAGED